MVVQRKRPTCAHRETKNSVNKAYMVQNERKMVVHTNVQLQKKNSQSKDTYALDVLHHQGVLHGAGTNEMRPQPQARPRRHHRFHVRVVKRTVQQHQVRGALVLNFFLKKQPPQKGEKKIQISLHVRKH